MANDRPVPEALIMYITVTPGGKESAVVRPRRYRHRALTAKDRGASDLGPVQARHRIALAR